MPLQLLRVLSPARVALLDSLQPLGLTGRFAPISVIPPVSMWQAVQIFTCILIFLTVRELTCRQSEHKWLVSIPLLVVGASEAALGMLQYFQDQNDSMAKGTFVDRDHFAGLLEMILPFAVMYGVAVLRRTNFRYATQLVPTVAAIGLFSLAALMLSGILYSFSRMGFIIAMVSLVMMAMLSIDPFARMLRTRTSLAVIAVAVVLMFIFLPPPRLLERFAQIASSESVTADDRVQIWRQTLSLIAEYPVFGTGLGGFVSTSAKFEPAVTLLTTNAAHNDYLEFVAELGIVGFPILALLVGAVVVHTTRVFLRVSEPSDRSLAIACLASLAAMLLHSFVDFNLHIPSNAMTFAWICGIASGLSFRE
jgi:O-antigen ligase